VLKAALPLTVINKARDLKKSMAEKLREKSESTHLLTIPFTLQLSHFSGDLGDLPVFDQSLSISCPSLLWLTRYFDEEDNSKGKSKRSEDG
jgi:hypothetical protein